ncbi:MAG: hypothetical protein P8017_11255, partial [Deltaproteobacteria bacterium]
MAKFTLLFPLPKFCRQIRALILMGGLLFFAAQVVRAAENSQSLVRQLAELGDRSTGAPGCSEAADKIEKAFRDLGIESVGRQHFLLPVTHYQPAYLGLKGRNTPIWPIRLD